MAILNTRDLADALVERALVAREVVDPMLDRARESGRPLPSLLIEEGHLDETAYARFLSDYVNLPFVDLRDYVVEPAAIDAVPEALARRHRFVPLFRTPESLTIATADPFNVFVLDMIRARTKLDVETAIATAGDIAGALDQHYGSAKSAETLLATADPTELERLEMRAAGDDEGPAVETTIPVVQLVNLMIIESVKQGASDIHIEPERRLVRVRFRVDGVLREVYTFSRGVQDSIVSRIKVMANLNIAETRLPQDGRIRTAVEGKSVDIRVSTVPTMHGENTVMRLLGADASKLKLSALGLSAGNERTFLDIIKAPYGMVLVTGPTGSGKTTTLYAVLNRINAPDRHIITVEDPVEYQLDLVRQIQVNETVGITFATGLRSILRQDPDAIMVGEIRDAETADIAVQSALTGHLLISTVHTNDAAETVTRLVDMGVEPYLLASSLVGIVAQRLVRKVCSGCRAPLKIPDAVMAELGLDASAKPARGKGCAGCRQTGYQGRTGIFEILALDDAVRELIGSRAPAARIREVSRIRTLRDDAREKVAAGVTTPDEALRATRSS